jgi:hypothetical protein
VLNRERSPEWRGREEGVRRQWQQRYEEGGATHYEMPGALLLIVQAAHAIAVLQKAAAALAALRDAGHELRVRELTGLRLDPYFSASKFAWILDQTPGARDRAARGELACGTIDAWVIWNLTAGRVHATDASNASRTMLADIKRGAWSDELCALFRVPRAMLPEIVDSAGVIGAPGCLQSVSLDVLYVLVPAGGQATRATAAAQPAAGGGAAPAAGAARAGPRRLPAGAPRGPARRTREGRPRPP